MQIHLQIGKYTLVVLTIGKNIRQSQEKLTCKKITIL